MTQFLRDLSTFNKEEINEFLGSFDTVLTDGDGVLWYLHEPLAGSVEAINRLKSLGKKVFLVSNNAATTVDDYVAKGKEMNLNWERDEIIIPSAVASEYLKQQDFKKKAFMLATSAFVKELDLQGIKCSSDVGPNHLVADATEFMTEMKNLDHDVGAVIVDFDININYVKMMKAVIHLKNPHCHFIVGGRDFYVPITDNNKIIGAGGFISILEDMSGRIPVMTGKPNRMILDVIAKRHPINPERTIMIGDALDSDMGLATNCGFQKLLVLSGVATLEDAKKDIKNKPHYYISSLGDLIPVLPTS